MSEELDVQTCILVEDGKCCIEGRAIFIAGKLDFLKSGETYYVTTRCEQECSKVDSIYFYDENTQQRTYFTNLGVYDYVNTVQLFEYESYTTELVKHLVIEGTGCFEVNFSRVNPLFHKKTLTIENEMPLTQLYDTSNIAITSSYVQELTLKDRVIVGPQETVYVTQYADNSLCPGVMVISGGVDTVVNTTIVVNEYYEEISVRGGGNVLDETEDYTELNKTHSIIVTNTLEQSFKEDFTFKGIELASNSELFTYLDDIDRIRKINLDALDADKKRDYRSLPVQPISNNTIMLNIPFDGKFNRLFENGTRYLRKTVMGDLTTLLIPHSGFLGVSAFKHNFVVFDPRPYVTTKEGERPLFPGYEPICSKKTYDEILEHVYSTVYPKNKVPAFPNFRIGDFAINGEIYNPLYDYRNFRLFGVYDFANKNSKYDLFISEPLTSLDSRFVLGRYVKIGSNYYKISTDYHNSGAKNTSVVGEVIQKVKPVNTKFEKVSKTLYDLNSSYQIAL